MRLLLQFPKQIPTNFSKRTHSAKAKKKQKLIRVEAPFIDEISGLAIIKMLHL